MASVNGIELFESQKWNFKGSKAKCDDGVENKAAKRSQFAQYELGSGVMPVEQSERRQVDRFRLKPQACCERGELRGYFDLDRIHSVAAKDHSVVFKKLMHHLHEDNLRQAFRGLDGSKAVGIDHVTKSEYGRNLHANIASLTDQIRRGGWRPRPTREVLIPKPSGGMRPLAIGCLEDKIVQTLVAKITSENGTENKHKTKSRMRKSRKSGSERSGGRQPPLFT